jgi:hypothetical protein
MMDSVLNVTRNVETAVDVFFLLNMYVNCVYGKKSAGNWDTEDDEDAETANKRTRCGKKWKKTVKACKTRFQGPLYAAIFAYK